MLKVLIKKELYRFFKVITTARGSKKKASKLGTVAMLVLWVFVYFSMIMAFIGVDSATGDVLLYNDYGLEWLFFALSAIPGFTICVVLSMFITSSALFRAKDNELLGSMPIPPKYILISRMSSIYIQNVLYASVAFIPAQIVSFLEARDMVRSFSGISLALTLLSILPTALLALAVACVFGWVIAEISKKLQNRSYITVIISVICFGAYYYFNFNMNRYVAALAANALVLGGKLSSNPLAWPIIQLGKACAGNVVSFIMFSLFAVAIFAVVCAVLSKNYYKISTSTSHEKKKEYVKDDARNSKSSSVYQALHRKELRRFLNSAAYMLNCGLGIIFMVGIAVAALVKSPELSVGFKMYMQTLPKGIAENIVLVMAAAVAMVSTMNTMAAPSISLEGNMIWILQSSPVDYYQVFRAKRRLQIEFTLPPALLMYAALIFSFGIGFGDSMVPMGFVIIMVFSFLDANLALICNLIWPKMEWTSETVPIKQSFSVVIMMFGPWLAIAAFAGLYYLLRNLLLPDVFATIVIVVLAVLYKLTDKWLRTKGVKKFATL